MSVYRPPTTSAYAPSRVPMQTIRSRNAIRGHHFFEPGTMRFFRSRAASYGYLAADGKVYFVTSEQFTGSDGRASPRRYSVCVQNPDGDIDTVGEFQAYGSRSGADAKAFSLAIWGKETPRP